MTQTPVHLLLAAALATAVPTAPFAQTAGAGPAAVRLPALGDVASEGLSVGAEHRLGEQIMAELRRDPDYLDDPLLLDYVQSLWTPLLALTRQRGNIDPDIDTLFAWEPFLVRDRAVNAFALPGGYVGVYLGLIAMTTSSDELASVLAHELSHVTQRHIARSIVSANRQSLVGLAAMILGVLATTRSSGNGDATQAVIVGGQAAMAQGQLNFSRDMEREADRIGWGVYTGAGFAPVGVATMFEKLESAYRLNDSGAFPYLRSHPLTVERIGEARARVEAAAGTRGAVRSPLDHQLMQARARVLMDSGVQALRRQQALDATASATPLPSVSERLVALYGSALASLQLREGPRAQAALDAAIALNAVSQDARAGQALTLLQAQVLQANGQPERALARLDALASAATPGSSRPLLLARAQAAFEASRASANRAALRPSIEALQTWVAEHGGDATAWSLLAQCASAQGLPLRALRAEAEARASLGDLGGAIDRMGAAQRQARTAAGSPDFIEASIIDARLRDLNAQRRAQLAEARRERAP
jgi:beta-barrel assembly-enhancing protease